MTRHIYSIGQSVTLGAGARIYSNPTVYTVTGLLPPLGVEFQYRIRGECEAHERVVVEHTIKALGTDKNEHRRTISIYPR
jgi:hypothetical protein